MVLLTAAICQTHEVFRGLWILDEGTPFGYSTVARDQCVVKIIISPFETSVKILSRFFNFE